MVSFVLEEAELNKAFFFCSFFHLFRFNHVYNKELVDVRVHPLPGGAGLVSD